MLSLVDLLRRYPRRAGARNVRAALERRWAGATHSKSDLEDLFLAFAERGSLPRPETNVVIEGCEKSRILQAAGWRFVPVTYLQLRDALGKGRPRRAAPAGAALRFRPVTRALTDPWTLGGRTIENRVVLAPLAGIGNWFVRLQARRYGAGLVVSEMVSSFGLAHGNERTLREFLRIHPDEHPVSLQLFGHDAAVMREAAAIAAAAGADLIDLNMGCPVRKVCKTGAGAALLEDPKKAVAIATAAREGSRPPGDGEAPARQPPGRPSWRKPRP